MTMFSVIMPTYNRGHIIEKAIHSVINQTYRNWELLIVDDGSADNTCHTVSAIKDSRIHYIRYETNKGANHARNIGIENASGEYLAFLDSDNQWHKDYLESQLSLLQNDATVDVVFARCVICGIGGYSIFPNNLYTDFSSNDDILKYALYDSVFDMNVMCMKRLAWNRAGKFDEKLPKFQDWEFALRMLVSGMYQFRFNNAVLCDNYIQGDSIANKKELFWEARLYILANYIKKCREIGKVTDIVLYLLKQPNVRDLSSEHVKILISLLSPDEVTALYKKYYEEYAGQCTKHYELSHKIENLRGQAEYTLNLAEKNERILQIERKWIMLRQSGGDLASRLAARGIYQVGLYGYGVLGKLLLRELKNSCVKVQYIIDKNGNDIEKCDDMPVILDKFESYKRVNDVDAIIVTAVSVYEEIKLELRKKTDAIIINLEELLI